MKFLIQEQLHVWIAKDRAELGQTAASFIAQKIQELLATKEEISIIFAAAPSQSETLENLLQFELPFHRIRAFHMDEYIGLPAEAPQGFGNFLHRHLFAKAPFLEVHYLNGQAADPSEECVRYAHLLSQFPPDIVCMGIGENTHLAFNDPHVADLNDPNLVKIVDLDEACRVQQVNDGCFSVLTEVPTHALTLTVPALLQAPFVFCMVPGPTKADAILKTLTQPIQNNFPSTALRRHQNAALFIDQNSSALIPNSILDHAVEAYPEPFSSTPSIGTTQRTSSLINTSIALLTAGFLSACGGPSDKNTQSKVTEDAALEKVTFVTLEPGHFHAALVHKESYPREVDSAIYVYAPEGKEFQSFSQLIQSYNTRNDQPTNWQMNIYNGEDYAKKAFEEKKGNVLVLAGNNRYKTDYITQGVQAGFHVLSDKPMAIDSVGFQKLTAAFEMAAQNNVLLYDIMTERFEINSLLQRSIAQIPEIFGTLEKGSEQDPSVVKESVHHFYKQVSGKPLVRPAWYYDVRQEGMGLVDVTTHLVDLVQWACFPDQILSFKNDVVMKSATVLNTPISLAQFEQSTGNKNFPDYLNDAIKNGTLQVAANGEMNYALKGVHAKIRVIWNYEAPAGTGDTHYSLMRGTKAQLIVRQADAQNYKPVLYLESRSSLAQTDTNAMQEAFLSIKKLYEGVELRLLSPLEANRALGRKTNSAVWEVVVPQKYHTGHEAHFAEVTRKFLAALKAGQLPEWEVPNMLAKYYTTTQALSIAQTK
jgi:6-phosphogluconolactonase/glucosamine-6-phosphate isomerase/deaminase/predicted dehydrogenase